MKTTLSNARNNLTRLLRRAEGGEVILLTRNGKPIVELRAVPKPPQSDEERLNEAFGEVVSPSFLAVFDK
jgi:antitoxin (DNA-binding transcriptional repressor) of toxin-antitoxin stability system